MSNHDPVSDLCTRIRNAHAVRQSELRVPASRLKARVLDTLLREGYIRAVEEKELRPGIRELRVQLKYHDGEPVISRISRVSTPGRRVYTPIKTYSRIANGLGIAILSTSKGVLSDIEARAHNVGGEVLCEVF
ncbi:MAG: 30S ribosomal protein S8 [Alphaproteobacteria bacterium]|jgi:small subunit ribosomal protein S8|nr:30S ribosomal protein S8 [Thalassospira sp.]MCE2965116.1 30S ribosomal protein S8 [Alphaproteobacteria bacterium]